MSRKLLNISADDILLATRVEIFRRAAFDVVNAKTAQDVIVACVDHDFSGVVIGHTLSEDQKKQIIRAVRKCCKPSVKIIGLYVLSRSETLDVDYSVSTAHPRFLVDVLRQLFPSAQE